MNDEMHELPVGEPGECVVRGPSVMSGYLDDPEATEEAFRAGGFTPAMCWCVTEDGTLSYVDRKKYLIKTGGENVYPAEVEQAIVSHPGRAGGLCARRARLLLGRDDQGGGSTDAGRSRPPRRSSSSGAGSGSRATSARVTSSS